MVIPRIMVLRCLILDVWIMTLRKLICFLLSFVPMARLSLRKAINGDISHHSLLVGLFQTRLLWRILLLGLVSWKSVLVGDRMVMTISLIQIGVPVTSLAIMVFIHLARIRMEVQPELTRIVWLTPIWHGKLQNRPISVLMPVSWITVWVLPWTGIASRRKTC